MLLGGARRRARRLTSIETFNQIQKFTVIQVDLHAEEIVSLPCVCAVQALAVGTRRFSRTRRVGTLRRVRSTHRARPPAPVRKRRGAPTSRQDRVGCAARPSTWCMPCMPVAFSLRLFVGPRTRRARLSTGRSACSSPPGVSSLHLTVAFRGRTCLWCRWRRRTARTRCRARTGRRRARCCWRTHSRGVLRTL